MMTIKQSATVFACTLALLVGLSVLTHIINYPLTVKGYNRLLKEIVVVYLLVLVEKVYTAH